MTRTLVSALSIAASACAVSLLAAAVAPGVGARSARVAFVSELYSDDGKAEGRFDAHWESESGQESSQGPEATDIVRALDWARAHADVVIVHTADGRRYSAGKRPADGVSEVWPEGGLSFQPRPIATKWVVLVRVSPGAANGDETQRALDALGRSPLVESVEVVHGTSGVGIRGVVRSESAPEALKAVYELIPPDVRTGWREEPADLEVLGPA